MNFSKFTNIYQYERSPNLFQKIFFISFGMYTNEKSGKIKIHDCFSNWILEKLNKFNFTQVIFTL